MITLMSSAKANAPKRLINFFAAIDAQEWETAEWLWEKLTDAMATGWKLARSDSADLNDQLEVLIYDHGSDEDKGLVRASMTVPFDVAATATRTLKRLSKEAYNERAMQNVEVFEVKAPAFFDWPTWMAERLAEAVRETGELDLCEIKTAADLRQEFESLVEAVQGEHFEPGYKAACQETLKLIGDCADKLAGYYWWNCMGGCLPDSEATGPFKTEAEAVASAIETNGDDGFSPDEDD